MPTFQVDLLSFERSHRVNFRHEESLLHNHSCKLTAELVSLDLEQE